MHRLALVICRFGCVWATINGCLPLIAFEWRDAGLGGISPLHPNQSKGLRGGEMESVMERFKVPEEKRWTSALMRTVSLMQMGIDYRCPCVGRYLTLTGGECGCVCACVGTDVCLSFVYLPVNMLSPLSYLRVTLWTNCNYTFVTADWFLMVSRFRISSYTENLPWTYGHMSDWEHIASSWGLVCLLCRLMVAGSSCGSVNHSDKTIDLLPISRDARPRRHSGRAVPKPQEQKGSDAKNEELNEAHDPNI